jgi:hypothetical protein
MTKSNKITKNKEEGKEKGKHGDKNQEKWATFTYCGKEVNTALKYLKLLISKKAYKTNNTIEKILAYEYRSEIVKFSRSGVYQLREEILRTNRRFIPQQI